MHAVYQIHIRRPHGLFTQYASQRGATVSLAYDKSRTIPAAAAAATAVVPPLSTRFAVLPSDNDPTCRSRPPTQLAVLLLATNSLLSASLSNRLHTLRGASWDEPK